LLEDWDALAVVEKQALLRDAVNRIDVTDDATITISLRP
jgi:hypothetical protein